MRSLATLLVSVLALFAQAAAAQDTPTRVGRVAYIEGPVSVYQDPELGWDKAYVNSPITSENSLWTDPGARAEVRIGGLALRLDEATQLDISHLDDDGIDAHVESGALVARVRHFDRNERYRFTTPDASFRLLANGRYRIDVDSERGESRLTVTSGSAELESARGGVRVDAGRAIVVSGGPSPSYALERARTGPFDRWADARDQQWSESTATRYVSTDITGYEDLDRYGTWSQDPDYGTVWYPTRVAAGWAPYRYGHWSYVRPWGWTWIDDQPWGYAPSHYGRWVYVGNRWGWNPGGRVERQAWAPALVGWIGGSNWSIGVSSGASAPAVGWYPLSPWERYEPWYRASPSYVNRVNIIVRDRDRAPSNWQGRGDDWRRWNRDRGATVVQRDAFVQRRPVAQAQVRVTPEVMRQQPQAQAANVLPTRNELQRFQTQQRQSAPAAQQPATAPQAGAQRAARGDRQGRNERPDFARPQSMPAPAPAAQAPQQGQPGAPRSTADVMNPGARNLPQAQQPQRAAPAPAPQANPLGRADAPQQREAQQQQERSAREAQQNQERAAREAQQNQQREQQQRAAKEAQQNQLQQQNQQREQQQRAAKEAQQTQERAAREAQQNQQREQQQRAAKEAQQTQERAAREAQQNQQREQQQRAAKEAQQNQERAAREAQQNQQREQQQRATKEAQQNQLQQQNQQREQQQRAAKEAQQQQQQLQRQQREAQQQQQERAPRGSDDKAAKAEKTAKPDKPDKADKADKPDKPDREEGGGGRQR